MSTSSRKAASRLPRIGGPAAASSGPATERFAPSPTGFLHLGHAYSALLAWRSAEESGGRLLLRIEDIDVSRCRPEYEDAIKEDLRWLGIAWDPLVLRQSDRMDCYAQALRNLEDRGLLYPCCCTRGEIEAALSAPQDGDGRRAKAYPGTCRPERGGPRHPDRPICLRLHMERAIETLGGAEAMAKLGFEETGGDGSGPCWTALDPAGLLRLHGDTALARKDVPTSYHLAVVVDDAAQGVTRVTRGMDLISMTPLHRLLQALLGLPTPVYRHHALVRDIDGRRLAKRDRSLTLRSLRQNGVTPRQVAEALACPDKAVEALRPSA